MKKLILYIPLALIVFLFSCEDEDKIRLPDLEQVVNMRIVLDPSTPALNADDIAGAILILDFFTDTDNIGTVQLFGEYNSFSQDSVYSRALISTVQGSQFDSNGVLKGFTITSQEIADAFGLSFDDMQGADKIDFFNVTTLTDGRIFPDTVLQGTDFETLNVTPNIRLSAGTTSFTCCFTVFVACPDVIENPTFATGAYFMEQVSGPSDAFFGNSYVWAPMEVTMNAPTPLQRTVTGTYVTFGGVNFSFLLICNAVLVPHQGSGIGCGGPGLNWIQDGVNAGTYDITDDGSFELNIIDNVDQGCGVPATPAVLKFTKL